MRAFGVPARVRTELATLAPEVLGHMARRTPGSVVLASARLLASAAAAVPWALSGKAPGAHPLWGAPGKAAAVARAMIEDDVDVLEGIDAPLLDAAWAWLSPRGRGTLLRLCYAAAATASAGARREAREAAGGGAGGEEDSGRGGAPGSAGNGAFRLARWRRFRPDTLAVAPLQGRAGFEAAFEMLAAFELQQLGVVVSTGPPATLLSALGPGPPGAEPPPLRAAAAARAIERRVLRRHVARAALAARFALAVHDAVTGGARRSWAVPGAYIGTAPPLPAIAAAEPEFEMHEAYVVGGFGLHTSDDNAAAGAGLPPVLENPPAARGSKRGGARRGGGSSSAGAGSAGGAGGEGHGGGGGGGGGLGSWLRRRRPWRGDDGGEARDGGAGGRDARGGGGGGARPWRPKPIGPLLPAGAAPPPPAPPLPLPPPQRSLSWGGFTRRLRRLRGGAPAPPAPGDASPLSLSAGGALICTTAGNSVVSTISTGRISGAPAPAASGAPGSSRALSLRSTGTATEVPARLAPPTAAEACGAPSIEELWRSAPLGARLAYHSHVWWRTLWLAAMGDPAFWQDAVDLAAPGPGGRGGWVARLWHEVESLPLRAMALLAMAAEVRLAPCPLPALALLLRTPRTGLSRCASPRPALPASP
jgi:hypothetical protein